MSNKTRSIMQAFNAGGGCHTIVIERNLDSGVVTLKSIEVVGMWVYTDKATLVDIDDEDTRRSPWVSELGETYSALTPENEDRNLMQVVNSRGQYATVLLEPDVSKNIVTITSTEVTGMRVYIEKAALTYVEDTETDDIPWVTDFAAVSHV